MRPSPSHESKRASDGKSGVTRRRFLGAATGLVVAGCSPASNHTGKIVGADSSLGHRLRDGSLPKPTGSERHRAVIVGGGIAGLAAARALIQGGFDDFVLLELESETGGNSRSGFNSTTAYPWGAHYLPLPGSHAPEILRLLEELRVIRGRDASGSPIYREEFLCHDPSERLFIHGRWQEGIIPQLGLSPAERDEMSAFLTRMNVFRNHTGSDGRPAFAIPIARSSSDSNLSALDSISMAVWMDREGFRSGPLRWYVNYCCRDDFGAGISSVSAWATIHYFAARSGTAANAPSNTVLTWPEGNGWLAGRMREAIPPSKIRTGCGVFRIEPSAGRAEVDCFNVATGSSIRLESEAVIFAGPRFVFNRICPSAPRPERPAVYAPWMVANLSLDSLPVSRGADLAWDNVLYDSASLGYVVATHQHLNPHPRATVLTYYQPLDHAEPVAARTQAQQLRWPDWCDQILADLSKAHPDLRRKLTNLDVMLWGHGMVCPVPGFIYGDARKAMHASLGPIRFAHSDMSGVSIFEEAFMHGTAAAESVLAQFGRRPQAVADSASKGYFPS